MRCHKVLYSGLHVNTRPSDGGWRAAAGAGGRDPKGRWRGKPRGVAKQKRGGTYQEVGVAYRKSGRGLPESGRGLPKSGRVQGVCGRGQRGGAGLKAMATPPPRPLC